MMANRYYDDPADVEVVFQFNNQRRFPAQNGYRPAHKIAPNCLTTGVHHYFDVDFAWPNEQVRGTITFIQPDEYPNTMYVGKTIPIQEGDRVVGYATVTKVLNPVLQLNNQSEDILLISNANNETC